MSQQQTVRAIQSPWVHRNQDYAQYPKPRGSQYEGQALADDDEGWDEAHQEQREFAGCSLCAESTEPMPADHDC